MQQLSRTGGDLDHTIGRAVSVAITVFALTAVLAAPALGFAAAPKRGSAAAKTAKTTQQAETATTDAGRFFRFEPQAISGQTSRGVTVHRGHERAIFEKLLRLKKSFST